MIAFVRRTFMPTKSKVFESLCMTRMNIQLAGVFSMIELNSLTMAGPFPLPPPVILEPT